MNLRRTIAALATSLLAAGAIAGCGKDDESAETGPPNGTVVVAGTPYAPSPELRKLIDGAARGANAALTQRDPATDAAAQARQLKPLLEASSGLKSVVVGAFDPAATETLIAARGSGGPAVISLLTPLTGASTTLTLDAEAVSGRLARAAGAWASSHAVDAATVLMPPEAPVADWSAGFGRTVAKQLVDDLSEEGLAVTALEATGTADAKAALGFDPGRLVIGWNDATALGAAQAITAKGTTSRWVGAAGSPTPSSADALTALSDGRLNLIVGTRLQDLASLIVATAADPPSTKTRALPVRSFSRSSAVTSAAVADFSGG
ncbi:MAG: hypothetical protein J7513_08245 [Solirubrobacteraceae bacterium]|nr:hypothetical protein [Solirubrobacteraceae bacterium]